MSPCACNCCSGECNSCSCGSCKAFITAIFLQYNTYQTRTPTAGELAGIRCPPYRAKIIVL
ncbi:hypothetical protein N7475_009602 [Penicillium sp. IBT 31633x]|nr:hypothetical protein N7475_009602 [Penicillium sp. IBT 31633x]